MNIVLHKLQGGSRGHHQLLAGLGLMLALGVSALLYIEHYGHIVTGMNNQFVWGLPDVFSIFLMLSGPGTLSIALLASVFGKVEYEPVAPLSGLLAIALVFTGLMLLMLDLGRPDRASQAMLHFNPKSVLSWNLYLSSGFMGFVGAYLWSLMEPGMRRFTPWAIGLAFAWRIGLTTGTGSIYGFQVARQGFDSAIFAPMYIALSLSYGLAVFVLVLLLACRSNGIPLGDALLARLARLQVIFIGVALYFVLIHHMTNYYFTRNRDFERFILFDGGIYTNLFWFGQMLLGTIVPFALLARPPLAQLRARIAASAALIVLGAFAQLYVTILGGQAQPLPLFPGHQVSSSFFDGIVNSYTPSLSEWGLGVLGLALVGLIVTLALKLIAFLPQRLDDAALQKYRAKHALAAS